MDFFQVDSRLASLASSPSANKKKINRRYGRDTLDVVSDVAGVAPITIQSLFFVCNSAPVALSLFYFSLWVHFLLFCHSFKIPLGFFGDSWEHGQVAS